MKFHFGNYSVISDGKPGEFGYTAIDNKIINFTTDYHTRGDFKVLKPHCKVNA